MTLLYDYITGLIILLIDCYILYILYQLIIISISLPILCNFCQLVQIKSCQIRSFLFRIFLNVVAVIELTLIDNNNILYTRFICFRFMKSFMRRLNYNIKLI